MNILINIISIGYIVAIVLTANYSMEKISLLKDNKEDMLILFMIVVMYMLFVFDVFYWIIQLLKFIF